MSSEDEAKIAIAGLNGQDFHGSQINVEVSCTKLLSTESHV